MNWMISLACLLLITTVTGSIAQMIWYFAKKILEQNGYLQWCHRGLWGMTLLYLFPVVFIGMAWGSRAVPA